MENRILAEMDPKQTLHTDAPVFSEYNSNITNKILDGGA